MIAENLIPEDFKAEITREMGRMTAEKLIDALSDTPETSVRLNVRKPLRAPLYPDMSPVPWCGSGFYLAERPNFTMNPLLHAGAFYVQEASSMVYETVVNQVERIFCENACEGHPLVVADLCAAPGGKTTAILNALPGGSVMLANEFVAARAKILKENLVKYGYPNLIVTNSDVSRLSEMGEIFDIVAVDAPCSGEGMMRKEEAARTQWSPGLVAQCASLQRAILKDAVRMLKPGGFLIYSTCTFNIHEDEENAAWIRDELGMQPVDSGLAGVGGIQPQICGDIPCLRFMPGFTRGEGLFLALFRKTGDPEVPSLCRQHRVDDARRKTEKKGKKGSARPSIDKNLISEASSWLHGDFDIREHDGRLLALSSEAADLLDKVPKGVRVVSAGVEVAEIKGKDLIPAHPLAMSTALSQGIFPEVELTESEALKYLAREPIVLPPDTPKGYVLMTSQGMPLGFMKNLGTRANNLYPQEWRIRTLR